MRGNLGPGFFLTNIVEYVNIYSHKISKIYNEK